MKPVRLLNPFPLLRRLVRDEAGLLSSVDFILFVTIVSIGSIVGLSTMRNNFVQEFGDIGVAIENLEQTYTVDITFRNGTTKSFGYVDNASPTDVAGQPPGGIELNVPPDDE